MNKAVEKFLNYILEAEQKLKDDIKIKFISDYTKLSFESEMQSSPDFKYMREILKDNTYSDFKYLLEKTLILKEFIETSLDVCYEEHILFTDFNILFAFLEMSNLNIKERFDVIAYSIDKNTKIVNTIEGLTVVLDAEELLKNKNPNLSKDDYLKILSRKNIGKLLNSDDEDLNEKEKIVLEELDNAVKNNSKTNPILLTNNLFKRHYLEKMDSYNEIDIEIIIGSLKKLGETKENLQAFESYLNSKMVKKKKIVNIKPIKKEVKEIKKISQKEYNMIFKTIESYYDIQNQKVIKPLKLDDIIYLVSLLYKIDVEEKEIIKCVKNIYKNGFSAYDNVLTKFVAYYEKIKKSSNENINKYENNIIDYLKEMVIPDAEQDYVFWKLAVDSEAKNIFSIIDSDYNYELEEGKKLVK